MNLLHSTNLSKINEFATHLSTNVSQTNEFATHLSTNLSRTNEFATHLSTNLRRTNEFAKYLSTNLSRSSEFATHSNNWDQISLDPPRMISIEARVISRNLEYVTRHVYTRGGGGGGVNMRKAHIYIKSHSKTE